MDIWSGSISVESSSPSPNILPLEDLRLSTPSSATTPSSVLSHLTSSLSSARLSTISLIDPTRIPLFLAAGPSLELTTTSPVTASYFRKLFLCALPTDDTLPTTSQSRIALLVRVTPDSPPAPGSWKLTELAIYGAITYPPVAAPALPSTTTADLTPPNSSPPADATTTPTILITVHALPLSSHHAFLPHISAAKPTPEPVFIAPNPQETLNPSISQSAKKRGAAALDAAADPRKRAKRSAPPPPPLTLLGGAALNNRKAPASAGAMVKRERSPSPSPSSTVMNRSFGSAGGGRQLKRTESSVTVRSTGMGGAVAARKEVYGEIETRNRAELAKVVVAGMRACGLRDYRAAGRAITAGGAEHEEEEWAEKEREKEKEEYKQVYYHTVKAAAFAMRNVIAAGTVNPEKMREVVDRLLSMFCEPRTGHLLLEAAQAAE